MKWFAVICLLFVSNCWLATAQTPTLTLTGSFAPGNGFVNEGDTLQACVAYDTLPASEETVVVSTRDGDAGGATVASGDYASTIQNLVFGRSDNTQQQCVNIDITQDSVLEDLQIFEVVATINAVDIAGSPGSATIQSSDTITIGFGATEYRVNENENDRMACVVIEQGGIESSVGVDVTLTATDGTATVADSDYNSATFGVTTLTLDSNTAAQGECITLPITDDDTVEPDESFTITIDDNSRVMFDAATRTTTVVIVNDDAECADPPMLTNGNFVLSGSSPPPSMFGDTAMYSCDSNYVLEGVDTLTCELGNMWSPASPGTCLRDCGTLSAPANGAVAHPQTTAGSTATYTCISGYTVEGDATRTCMNDGTWSGSEPTCRLLSQCPDLPLIDNGSVSPQQGTEGDIATYSCEVGYTVEGDATRTCMSDGTWSGSEPTCRELNQCDQLPLIDNGSVSPREGTEGDVATYSCEVGYTLRGDMQRTCEQQGWSGSEPSCEEVTLPPPPATAGQQGLSQDQMIGIGVGVGVAVLIILILVIVAVVVIVLYSRHKRADKYVLNYSTVYGNQNKPEMTSQPVEPNVYEERSVDRDDEPSGKPSAPEEAETQA